MKNFRDYLSESEQAADNPVAGDTFAINIREECLIESVVVESRDDGVVIAADEHMMRLLESYGYTFEENCMECGMNEGDCGCNHEQVDEIAPVLGAIARTAVPMAVGAAMSDDDETNETRDPGEYDQEGDMAKNELYTMIRSARKLIGMLDNDDNMPEWTQKKINKATDYVDTAADYISSQKERGVMEQSQEDSPVARATLHRIMMRHPGMLAQHGPEKVMQAVDDVADLVGDMDDIGTSDISGWVNMVQEILDSWDQGVAEAVWDRPSQSYVPRDGRVFGQTNHPREEHCDACGAATGHAGPGEDSNVDDNGNVYCDDCYAGEQDMSEGLSDIVKGVKRYVKGKEQPDVVAAHHFGRALGHYHQGEIPAAEKETKRYNKVQSMNKGNKTLPYPMDARWKKYGVAEGSLNEAATMASVSKLLRHIERHNPTWFDDYGMGEVEDAVVDMAEMGQFSGMTVVDAAALVGQELESMYGANGMNEAEYQGRKVPLGKPMKGDVAKSKVYVKDPKTGNVKKVNFGDPNMKIKKSNPARRKSFRARHNCDNPGPRTKARYWSCRAW